MLWWILGVVGVLLYVAVGYMIFIAIIGASFMVQLIFQARPSTYETLTTFLLAAFWPIGLPIAAIYCVLMAIFESGRDWLHERTRR